MAENLISFITLFDVTKDFDLLCVLITKFEVTVPSPLWILTFDVWSAEFCAKKGWILLFQGSVFDDASTLVCVTPAA